jgi:Uma2 family endonuclease
MVVSSGRSTGVAEVAAPEGKLSFEEFLGWLEPDVHAEWVDGEVVPMTPVTDEHNDLGRFLLLVVGSFVDFRELGVVRYEPFQMKTGPDLPSRSPDLLFLAAAHTDRLRDTHLDGPADLVVEIVSPESRARDRGEKFYEYEAGGVLEYWLVDPQRRQVEFYGLTENHVYRTLSIDPHGRFASPTVPGLVLPVEWLWRRPLPPMPEVLAELGLIG